MFDFSNKTALVTGATSGIGLAISQQLAKAGAQVLINAESAAACEQSIAAFARQNLQAHAMPADMSDTQQIFAMIERIKREHKKLDYLFINAGITGNKAPGEAGYEENAQQVFAINIHAPRILCDHLLPFMATQGGGSAVLTSSLAGVRGNKQLGVYSLTKAAVAQLARDMAVKFGPDNIRVNAISPGLIATGWEKPILAKPELAQRRMQMTPLRRMGQPEEIANAALFLASDLASFITGHNLLADGGTAITDGS